MVYFFYIASSFQVSSFFSILPHTSQQKNQQLLIYQLDITISHNFLKFVNPAGSAYARIRYSSIWPNNISSSSSYNWQPRPNFGYCTSEFPSLKVSHQTTPPRYLSSDLMHGLLATYAGPGVFASVGKLRVQFGKINDLESFAPQSPPLPALWLELALAATTAHACLPYPKAKPS